MAEHQIRWQSQELDAVDESALPGLARLTGLVRTVRTPDFAGVTFHEVHAKSALNRVPGASMMPFEWTVNPMRGCVHRCTYCFARKTHEYLELDAGHDFDTQIVVKTNVAEVLRREVFRPSWQRTHVALGTNTDPYQRAEGRYRLMPGIITALSDSMTPISILTKGTLLRRDLTLLQEVAERVPVGIGVSLALLDPVLHQQFEPGTPTPAARLELVRAITDAGFRCTVMIAPVLPYLTDTVDMLDPLLAELADAGAARVTVLALHLRPGTKEWFLANLQRDRPELVGRYRSLYGRGAYVSRDYQDSLYAKVRPLVRKYHLDRDDIHQRWTDQIGQVAPPVADPVVQPALF